MGKLNEKGDINAAAIGVYIILTACIAIIFMKGGFRVGYLYVLLFTLIKIVGAAMTMDVQLTSNTSLYTPAAIISTVVLSPLLLGTTSLLNPGSDFTSSRNFLVRLAPKILRVNHLVIIASLGLGVVGGLDAFSTSPKPGDLDTGKKYLRIAAALSCLSWFLILLSIALLCSSRRAMGNFYSKLYPVVAGIVMPIFIARLVYTVGIAATIDEPNTTMIFNPLTGSWVVYLCLAFLPEVLIGTALVGVGLVCRKEDEGLIKRESEGMAMGGYQR